MKILRNMLSVLLVVVMVVTTVYSAVLLTVRLTVTENLVREVAENLNYAALPLPDGDENGGTTTITEVLNSSLSSLGITMTENEVNDALRSFSVNKIMSDLAAETREWLLGDGAEPTINNAKIAKTVTANMPESLSGLLSMFGNPEEVLAEMLSEYTSQLDLHEYFAKLEPYRPFLSEGSTLSRPVRDATHCDARACVPKNARRAVACERRIGNFSQRSMCDFPAVLPLGRAGAFRLAGVRVCRTSPCRAVQKRCHPDGGRTGGVGGFSCRGGVGFFREECKLRRLKPSQRLPLGRFT